MTHMHIVGTANGSGCWWSSVSFSDGALLACLGQDFHCILVMGIIENQEFNR